MKTIKRFICGALLLFIGSASLSAQTNLLTNGDFETLGDDGNPTGWLDMGTWDWVFPGTSSKINLLSDTDVPDGIGSSKSGKFIFHDGPNNGVYPQDWPMILTDKIPEGAIFDISFWIKGGPIVNSDVEHAGYNAAIENSMFENYANLPATYTEKTELIEGEWINLTYEGITSKTTAAQPWFALVLTVTNNQYFWLDDVKITLHDSQETTTNLIPNGNFEEVDANGLPANWYDGYNPGETGAIIPRIDNGNFSIDKTTPDIPEGTNAVYVSKPYNGSLGIYPYSNITSISKEVAIGKEYKLSFWYKATEPLNTTWSDHYITLEESMFWQNYSEVVSSKLSEHLSIIPNEWVFQEYSGLVSPESSDDPEYNYYPDKKFIFMAKGQNCNFWLDDVQMVEASGTGVNEVKADTQLPVYVSEGILYVGGTTVGETVSVYSTTGQVLKSEKAQSTTTKITDLSAGQVYIVRSGSKSAKVVL